MIQDVLLAIELLISVISIIISIRASKKVNNKNKKKIYYDFIFKEFLLNNLPNIYNKYIKNDGPNLEYEKQFEEIISETLKKIIVYQFVDDEFYCKVYDQLVDIDDTVVRIANHDDEYGQLKEKLKNMIKKLYKTVNDYYDK